MEQQHVLRNRLNSIVTAHTTTTTTTTAAAAATTILRYYYASSMSPIHTFLHNIFKCSPIISIVFLQAVATLKFRGSRSSSTALSQL